MAELADGRRAGSQPDGLSCDTWLGGRLTLVQPRRGHRAGTDAALLAAAADFPEGRFADVGAGVGSVALAILRRFPRVSADLVEIDPELAALAAGNAERNRLAERARILRLDVCDARADIRETTVRKIRRRGEQRRVGSRPMAAPGLDEGQAAAEPSVPLLVAAKNGGSLKGR